MVPNSFAFGSLWSLALLMSVPVTCGADERNPTTKGIVMQQGKQISIHIDSVVAGAELRYTTGTHPYLKGRVVRPGAGSVDEHTGWTYEELVVLGKGTHLLERKRTDIPLQVGPGGTMQVRTDYALKTWSDVAAKGMNVSIVEYDKDSKSILVTWDCDHGACVTSVLVSPGPRSVDGDLTGWTYDELRKLGIGNHVVQRRRIGEAFDHQADGSVHLRTMAN